MSKSSEKQNIVFLSDLKKNGDERPWAEHKSNSELLAESYRRLGYYRKFERVCECGSSLRFNVCPKGHEKKLAWANFCRIRLCPMCSWRKSLLNAHQVKLVAHEASKREKLRWLFLTLTVKNVNGDELEETIKNMSKSFHKMIRRKIFKERVVGFFKAFEVTRNAKKNNYHPHYHVLLAVRPSYFGKDYMQQSEWAQLWKDSLKVDDMPIVDIRTVKPKKKNQKKELEILESKGIEVSEDGAYREKEPMVLGGALSEIAKYTVKSNDFIKKTNPLLQDEIVSVLDKALARKRLLSFGGLLGEIWQELRDTGRVEDSEDEDANLIHVSEENKECKCSVCGSDMLEELYRWIPSQENYILKTDKKNNPVGTGLEEK